MAAHVLVGYDESPRSESALRHALTTYPEAKITVLHVSSPNEWIVDSDEMFYYSEEAHERATKHAEEVLAEAFEIAAEYDREIESETTTGRAASRIVEFADERGVDHIVVGSHGRRGINRFLLGSVAESVVRRSPCPVTVIRERQS